MARYKEKQEDNEVVSEEEVGLKSVDIRQTFIKYTSVLQAKRRIKLGRNKCLVVKFPCCFLLICFLNKFKGINPKKKFTHSNASAS